MEKPEEREVVRAAKAFYGGRSSLQITPVSGGHINRTWLVEEKISPPESERFILQQINTGIFQEPEALMKNILGVTEFLHKRLEEEVESQENLMQVLTFLPSRKGAAGGYLYRDDAGHCFRACRYIEQAVCRERVECPEQFYESGRAFGSFQRLLSDFPVEELTEILPDFHHTPKRYQDFCQAVKENARGRAAMVEQEIAFIKEREGRFDKIRRSWREGKLPLRVTHNDTKFSNVMLDAATKRAICVIDLDTVMPGFSVFDYGESIRFGANLAAEDEPDTEKIHFSLELAEQYTKGFLTECGGCLWQTEKELLAEGAWMMTMENGMRFLADYLQGDIYYQIQREKQNLDRARCQLALAADMERSWNKLTAMIQKYSSC